MSGRVVAGDRARGPNQLVDGVDVDRCGAAAGGWPMIRTEDVVDEERAQVLGPQLFPGVLIAVVLGVIVLHDVVAATPELTVDASHVVGTFDQVALNLGRGIIAVFVILFGSVLASEVVGRITSDAPKYEGVSASEPSNSVADLV